MKKEKTYNDGVMLGSVVTAFIYSIMLAYIISVLTP
jgi:hypothetical protein